MACYSQRSERTQVATIFECDQTERYNDQEDRFLVYMPSKQERSISTKGNCANKGIPLLVEEEFDKWDDLEEEGQDERSPCSDLG